MHFTTLIGPPAVECHWCGEVVGTARIEWWEMPWQGKAWFFGLSLLYLVLACLLGGLSTNVALHLLQTGEIRGDWGVAEPTFWIGGGVWAYFVGLIQALRVASSVKRKKPKYQGPLRRSLWSFQVGGQVKVLLLLLLIPAVCWIVSLFRHFP